MTKIRCDFVVRGHGHDPNVITQALGIQPTRTWRTGEHIQNTLVRYKHDGWCLSSGYVESLYLQEVAQPLLQRVRPRADKLADLIIRLGVEVELDFTVHLAGETPEMHFDRDMLEGIHQLQAEVDIDVYL